jgi:hypothetical protein
VRRLARYAPGVDRRRSLLLGGVSSAATASQASTPDQSVLSERVVEFEWRDLR